MRVLLSIILVAPLLIADNAWAQSPRRSSQYRRPIDSRFRNSAREYRNRSSRYRYRSSYGKSDWKQRLAAAKQMQYAQRSGNRVVSDQRYGYDPAPYYADDYYGSDAYRAYNGGVINPYGYFGQPPVAWDAEDFADIYFNKRYYDDGPNGPGYYSKDRWYNWSINQRRSDQLQDANQAGVDEGMQQFRSGNYDRAAIAWLNASTLDQGDAASRLQAGHALFALGRYDQSVKLLARAFELAPQLVGASFDVRSDYTNQGDFNQQLSRLEMHVAQNPNDVAGLTLLGYVKSYTVGPSHAYGFLLRARQLAPKDTFVEKLWQTAETVGPAANAPTPNQTTAPLNAAPRNEIQMAPGSMKQMQPVPANPQQGVPRQQGVRQQDNNPQAPAPKPEKMRLVSAQDPHR
ncbi:MAG: hypothetical protein H6819_08840 [Phycisphaerales bacterium]|nr:hypothetical protein [Phycisphaerales bacterium]MCB9855665.1 hypothetical protein [Phycisphaerales bacterium]MCB9862560.1 hypothetical protein [Phycisphaerales bacterium]